MNLQYVRRWLAGSAISCASILAACGGGGDSTAGADAGTQRQLDIVRLTVFSLDVLSATFSPLNIADDNYVVLPATAVCNSGTVTSTLNGAPTVAGNTLPLNGTLAASFGNCVDDDTTLNGTTSIVYALPASGAASGTGTLNATVTSMRVVERSSGNVLSDVLVNGPVAATHEYSTSGSDTTFRSTTTPGSGTTLRNALSGLTATYTGGSNFIASATYSSLGVETLSRVQYNNLGYAVDGVTYRANGFYQFQGTGNARTGSGEVVVTDGTGARVGRLFIRSNVTYVEANGTEQRFY